MPSSPDDCPVSSAACLFRVNALSLVYLLFLLLLPWFPGPSRHSIRGKGGWGSVGVGVWIQGSQSSFSRCPGQGKAPLVREIKGKGRRQHPETSLWEVPLWT